MDDQDQQSTIPLLDRFMLAICMEENDPQRLKEAADVWRRARRNIEAKELEP